MPLVRLLLCISDGFFITFSSYYNKIEFIWSQEEHRNMGAWTFMKPRFENMCGRKIVYSGRPEGATVATGIAIKHKTEVERILSEPFEAISLK